MRRSRPETLDDLVALTSDVKDSASKAFHKNPPGRVFNKFLMRVERQLCRRLDESWWADSLAQSIVCGELSVRLSARSVAGCVAPRTAAGSSPDERQLVEYLRRRWSMVVPIADSAPFDELLQRVRDIDFEPLMDVVADRVSGDPAIHCYEHFLAAYDAESRQRSGVYFTPPEVVRFLLQGADEVLRHDFDLPLGLADDRSWRTMRDRHPCLAPAPSKWEDEPFVRILDPACGTGAFLVELLAQIHRRMTDRWLGEGCSPDELSRRWSGHVRRRLLPRIVGFEVLMAPWAIAHVRLAATLAATGCWLEDDQALRIYLTNTLADPTDGESYPVESPTPEVISGDLSEARLREPMTVVIGNPPYAGISDNQDRWVRNLMRGRCAEDPRRQSYYHVDGRPLGERKLWLADDYVKFLRYGQWRIDRAGAGIMALVTNHGFLDNPTFRGARRSLMGSFSRISLVDLHGNVKKRERRREATADESVFATEQGMAVSLSSRPPQNGDVGHECRIDRGDLWGAAAKKRRVLETASVSEITTRVLTPAPPDYVFVERDETHLAEYRVGFRLPDIMPVGTTAVVTARDRLVVDFTRRELLARIEWLRDPSVADDEVRARCFPRRRSPKYPAGDTRGWKLGEARRRLQDDDRWRERVASCLYRPFDCRSIYWTDGMIDWPRTDVMRYLTNGANLALIARRQMLAGHECNYFWVTDRITIDGVIRSDNRGSESVFPLFVTDNDGPAPSGRVNFSEDFVRACEKAVSNRPIATGESGPSLAGPVGWLGYMYAQFHSPTYRRRYADLLRADFPRVFLTEHVDLWDELACLGCQLMAAHLDPHSSARELITAATADTLDEPPNIGVVRLMHRQAAIDGPGGRGSRRAGGSTAARREPRPPERTCHSEVDGALAETGPVTVAKGYPKYAADRVWVNPDAYFEGVSEDVWRFCVGAHQVCRKWLKDRRGRKLSDADVAQYAYLVAAIGETIRVSSQVDNLIEQRGGWPAAFGTGMSSGE